MSRWTGDIDCQPEALSEVPERRRRKLWIVSEIYYPEEISTGYYLTAIAEDLASDGFDVSVVCGQPNYAVRGKRAAAREARNGVRIFRVPSTTLDKNVIAFRIVNMLTLCTSIALFSLRRFRKGDHVLVVTAPPTLPFIAAITSRLRGSSYTLLSHDCYPEILFAVGKLRPGSVTSRTLQSLNRWLYKHASKIIVVGRDMRELIRGKMNGYQAPVITIPNWADLESIHPTPRETNGLLTELGLAEKFVLLYAGNIGHPTDVESIIESAEILRKDPSFHFIFVGSGAKSGWLSREVERRGLTNVSLLGQRPRTEQIVFLNACDVGLVSLVKDMWGSAMPSRTYNILAAGKPILALAENGSELARVIDEESVGWHMPPGDGVRLASLISRIAQQKETLAAMGLRARNAAINKYTRELATSRYASELKQCFDDHGSIKSPSVHASEKNLLT